MLPGWVRIVLAITLLLSCGRAARADEPSPEDRARMHFAAGVNLLRDPGRPRYDEALAEFKRAYAIKPAPSILGNMALCAMKLERDAEAIELYTRYLNEASGLDGEERAQVERDLMTLRTGLAKVTLSSKPDGAVIQDVRVPARGEPVTNIYGPLAGPTELGIRRGHHVMSARFPDGAEVRWEIDVNGGEAHVFEKPAGAIIAAPAAPDGARDRGSEPARSSPGSSRSMPERASIPPTTAAIRPEPTTCAHRGRR